MTEIKSAPVHEYRVQIQESHLDSYGHVNNANYLNLFEEARWDLISRHGYDTKRVHETAIGPVILEVHARFRRELKNQDRILIRSWIVSHSGKISVMRQVMINERGEDACVADFTIGLFDLKARKLIEPTAEWKAAFLS